MSDETVELDTRPLDKLIKAFKGKLPEVRIGILGNKDSRSGKVNSNAQVGAAHEYGTSELPKRSFLRMPLNENLNKYIEASKEFDAQTIRAIIRDGTLIQWLTKIGFIAETVVLDAFDSGGFGKWKPSNMKYKKVHQTLVETQQLRNSITSEVKE